MKAIALVVSARENGNCFDFATFILNRLSANGTETELINFFDHKIIPCQRCSYECMQHRNPAKGQKAACPIDDDVKLIWEKTWRAQILFLFIPNYGGFPPALWFAYSQRAQAFYHEAPIENLKNSVVSALIIGAPHYSSGAQWTPSIMADEIKWMDRKVAGFEMINSAGYNTDSLFGGLIKEIEIQRRLEFLADQTVKTARALA